MKRIKRAIAAITLASTLIFGAGSLVHVRADQTVGPQGQQQPAGQKDSAEQLRLAASTQYKIGWAEFGRGNIAGAIERYVESKRLFEEAHAKRDLIYILADLGSLYIYAEST